MAVQYDTVITVPAGNTSSNAISFKGGAAVIAAYGSDFDSATVTFEVSFDGGTTYMTVVDTLGNNVTFTANGYKTVVLPQSNEHQTATSDDCLVRVTNSGSSGSTSVTLDILHIFAGTRQGHF